MENKRANMILGSILALLGIIAWGTGLYLIMSPGVKEEDMERITAMNSTNCTQALRGVFGGVSGNSKLTVLEPGLADAEAKLVKASLGISMCIGYELESFCMGQACSVEGLEMTLRPAKIKAR